MCSLLDCNVLYACLTAALPTASTSTTPTAKQAPAGLGLSLSISPVPALAQPSRDAIVSLAAIRRVWPPPAPSPFGPCETTTPTTARRRRHAASRLRARLIPPSRPYVRQARARPESESETDGVRVPSALRAFPRGVDDEDEDKWVLEALHWCSFLARRATARHGAGSSAWAPGQGGHSSSRDTDFVVQHGNGKGSETTLHSRSSKLAIRFISLNSTPALLVA